MKQHTPEKDSNSSIDPSPFVIMGYTWPPRDPNDDEDDEDDDEDEEDEDEDDEPAVVREPDED
ncbi:hypothetical protein [Bradyrhizobium iriomotense]|uniref:hypothetical protein n=1 Tax=Bradyrhizobium iriomotense TaxID=441950 RepID=UPI001B89E0C1|nr:hypothetical protein [Bradyrhizobium iriomotense]MBR0787271.1 hypothetical protein [Bradyrhizobium iriomotense]